MSESVVSAEHQSRQRDELEDRQPSLREIETVFGARMLVHAGDRSRPEWVREGQELMSLVGPGMTVVDAGAGFGYCTLLCARAVGPEGRVVALEPEQDNYDLLRRNLRRHDVRNVEALQLAIGAQPSAALLWVSGTHRGRHSLHQANVLNPVGSRQVKVTTLDDVVDRHLPGGMIDLLKVDVEGEEMALVQGARQALAHAVSRVWFEFWPDGLARAGVEPLALPRALLRFGFTLTAVDLLDGQRRAGLSPEDLVEHCDNLAARLGPDGQGNPLPLTYVLAER